MEHQTKVQILNLNLDRHCFTTHGLHLSTKGKKLVSQDLVRLAQQFFNEKQILSTISTPRKDAPVTSSDSESQDGKINDETNKLASPDSESQDVKKTIKQKNWLFLLTTEETAQHGEIRIFYGHE